MMKRVNIIVLLCIWGITWLDAQVDARLFQYPDISSKHITFAYGGDLWIADKSGGEASKLSSPAGNEMFPKFSPDGSFIAFSGNYDGNTDVYVLPTKGGIPVRLTHHGMADRVLGWTPDGESVLFASSRESGKQRWSQIYKVSREGGLPDKLPMEHAEFGSLSPDGNQIAFIDKTRLFRTWKRYRGGMSADIWVFDLSNYDAYKITDDNYNDELPMWHGDIIYYLSDAGPSKRYNIWKYDTRTRINSQVTDFTDYDVHYPSIGPDHMIFEAGGKLFTMDLSTEDSREVNISVVTDLMAVKPTKKAVGQYATNMHISPKGERVLFEARGEIFSVPSKKGFIQNLTHTSGSAERYPAYSPNGRYVAYWSDASGEYELTLKDMSKGGESKVMSSFGPGYRYNIHWSPDNSKIAFVDQTMTIYVYDIETRSLQKVDQDLALFEGGLRGWRCSWSPDGLWMSYARTMNNGNKAVFLYNSKNHERHQLTSGFYSDMMPTFDVEGNYLFLVTNRNFEPVYSDFDNSWTYPNATQLAAIPLRRDIESPLSPENDEVEIEEEAENGEDTVEDAGDSEDPVDIDIEDFERRLVILPISPGNIGGIASSAGKLIYTRLPNTGSGNGAPSLKYYDLKEREEKTIIDGISGYVMSHDGKKAAVRLGNNFAVIDIAPNQKADDPLAVSDLEAMIDPREEWEQIFMDAWRFERDFFYDKDMHGVDWEAMKDQYKDMIQYCVTRSDVNFVLGELIGELNASHAYRYGGDNENAENKAVGYLGIDWAIKDDLYIVDKIIRGAPWDNEVRSPLDEPGVDVDEGTYILAVNGITLNTDKDPWHAFEGLAGDVVELTVSKSGSWEDSRTVIVETLRSETRLRNLAWINDNRKRVEEASNGQLGYIYVPSTGRDGQNELVRQFYGQWHKPGLVIDERFNNGGQIPDRFIELLNRKPLAYWDVRDGKNWQWPPVAHFGSMVMLINGWSGSGGDAFPDYFRKAGLGKLIGSRTWGGLIGISGSPPLVDGGAVTVPTFRMYNPDGTWFKEGHGVEPDIRVVEDPTKLAKGIDPQLEKAIEEVLESVREQGPLHPETPESEDRSRYGRP